MTTGFRRDLRTPGWTPGAGEGANRGAPPFAGDAIGTDIGIDDGADPRPEAALTRGHRATMADLCLFEHRGRVVHGRHLGRCLGAPTANLALGCDLPQMRGTYAAPNPKVSDHRSQCSI
jgi:hypothetical protein